MKRRTFLVGSGLCSRKITMIGRIELIAALLWVAGCGAGNHVVSPRKVAPVASPTRPFKAGGSAVTKRVKTPASDQNRLTLPAVLQESGGAADKSPNDGLQGAWARVFLRANPGPFQYVAYEITARGRAGVMSHLRGMMGRRDAIIRTELVPRAALREVFAALKALGAADLRPPPKPVHQATNADDDRRWPDRSAKPVYELSYRLGGVDRTVVIQSPYRSKDLRYARFINTVRAAVIARVGTIGYHGPTGEDGAAGYLHVDSVPTATVSVDGVRLPNATPVLAFALRPGTHHVVLENKRLGLVRTFKVRIRSGRTTSLEVDLR
ncbi:MAG: hypothetical protein KC502_04175 [Myxococcales bacterium]|nr:hypothetical protein [Myxococcales bacterium]